MREGGIFMSGYNMEFFLGDFANRTIENLKFIEDGAEQYKLYEVTQLINSLLGLIIIPVEKYKNTYNIKDVDIKSSSSNDYKTILDLIDKCERELRFYSDYEYERDRDGRIYVSNFIIHIRNAIAHGGNNGIHFYPVSGNDGISNVIFYDNNEMLAKKVRQNGNARDINEFCIRLSISELKNLVNAISGLYCQFEKKNDNVKEKQNKYDSDIRKLESLLKNGRPDKSKVIFEFEECDEL